MRLIDTHCHLDHEYFKNDHEQVMERACAAGVVSWINPSLQFENIPTVLALVERYATLTQTVRLALSHTPRGPSRMYGYKFRPILRA